MSFFPDTHSGVPPELKFVPQTHSDDVILNKQLKFYKPYTSKSIFKARDDIKFKITGDKSIDLRTFTVTFEVAIREQSQNAGPAIRDNSNGMWPHLPDDNITTTLQSYPLLHLHNYIGSIIKNLKIRFNDTVLFEELDDYNRLRWLLAKPTVDAGYQNSVWGAMEGYKNVISTFQDTAYIASTGVGTEIEFQPSNQSFQAPNYEVLARTLHYQKSIRYNTYTIRLDLSGFLGRWPKILFLPAVGSIDIEMRLEENSKILNNYDASAKPNKAEYVVRNVYAMAEEFDLSQAYLGSLKNVLSTTGLTCEFDSYLSYPFILKPNMSEQSIRLWRRLTSLKSIYFGIYRESSNPVTEEKKQDILARYDVNGLEKYQIFLDGRPLSARPITTRAIQDQEATTDIDSSSNYSEATFELMKALRYHGNVKNSPAFDQYDRTGGFTNAVYNPETIGNFQLGAEYHARPFAIYGVDLEKSNLLSGTNLSNELCIQLSFRQGYPLNTEGNESYTNHIYVFLHYDKRVTIHSGLRITELE